MRNIKYNINKYTINNIFNLNKSNKKMDDKITKGTIKDTEALRFYGQ